MDDLLSSSVVALSEAVVPDYEKIHIPVLRNEVLSFIVPREGMRILDGTLGLGGHAEAIATLLQKDGIQNFQYLGLDRDAQALDLAHKRLEKFEGRFVFSHANFSTAAQALDALGWEELDFALIDIGVSSMQIDSPDRGFSFLHEGPLDMRMDRSNGQPASHLVNKASVTRLREIIGTLGEEPMAGRIAKAIDAARAKEPIMTTSALAEVVFGAYPPKWRATSRNHPATRTFQALRIAVNDELNELTSFLEAVCRRLRRGGRLAVITFHSLEDRIVKHFFRNLAIGCVCPPHIPVCVCGKTPQLKILTRKPVVASEEECRFNSRASSAKLRVAEKL